MPRNLQKDVPTDRSNIPPVVPATPLRIVGPVAGATPNARPVADQSSDPAEAAVDDEAAAVEAHAEQAADNGMSNGSPSSSSSSSSDSPAAMQEAEASGVKRDRENDINSDEDERFQRLAAICAGLDGPHEENNFMDVPPTGDELDEARLRELQQLIDFDVFTEVAQEDVRESSRLCGSTGESLRPK